MAQAAIERLAGAGVPTELELLYGLPFAPLERVARAADVDIRVYVSYGQGYLPYALGQVRRRPRLLWWVVRDTVTGRRRRSLPAVG